MAKRKLPAPPSARKTEPTKKSKMPMKGPMPMPGKKMTHGSIGKTGSPAKKGGGMDMGKFASEVSQNYAKGAAMVGSAMDKMIGSRKASSSVPGAMKHAPANRAALKKALGK